MRLYLRQIALIASLAAFLGSSVMPMSAMSSNARLAITTCFGNTIFLDLPTDPNEEPERQHMACHVFCSQARKADIKSLAKKKP
jgi:hypothetical protein